MTQQQETAAWENQRSHTEDEDYDALLAHLRDVFARRQAPLFTTTADWLFTAFLAALPPERRGHYTCAACRHFVERFGGLVTIDREGNTASPLWDWQAPPFFAPAVEALASRVHKARVTGVFLSNERLWGLPENPSPKAPRGTWHHMHIVPPHLMVHAPGPLQSSPQVMAEKLEEHAMLLRGLAEYPLPVVRQAHTLLTSGSLYRSEKCEGVAKWLLDLHESIEKKRGPARENLTWFAAAVAPPGWCHIRSSMIGTLLDGIVGGESFPELKRAFDAKMSPTQYQRPTAAPSDGELAAAEKVVAALASAGSLARRRATLDEILPRALWAPKPVLAEPPHGGVFGHLRSKGALPDPLEIPAQTLTWEKFARTILPTAERLEFQVPRRAASYFGFVTAADPLAPPILQWDREDARNPVSLYVYVHGSRGHEWGLTEGTWRDVACVTLHPSSWDARMTGAAAPATLGAYFLLEGARDTKGPTSCLFPEILKSEYHGIRKAIEAYSASRKLGDLGGPVFRDASGICLQKSTGEWNETLRVTCRGAVLGYRIDRWD